MLCKGAGRLAAHHSFRRHRLISRRKSPVALCVAPLFLAVLCATAADAQSRISLPQGSVIIVRTATALESNTARVGQMFETIVSDTVRADDYTVIPAGS